MRLARWWRDHGRHGDAHALAAPVYGWFTEGFDTADLKEAKTLLEEYRQDASQRLRQHRRSPSQQSQARSGR